MKLLLETNLLCDKNLTAPADSESESERERVRGEREREREREISLSWIWGLFTFFEKNKTEKTTLFCILYYVIRERR